MLNFKIEDSQKLVFSKGPVIAADTTNLEAHFQTNALFTGELRAYWNVRGSGVDPYKVVLEDEKCVIPHEVMATIADENMYGDIDHILQVSVVAIGDDETIRMTSTTCEIPVYKSSYSGNTSLPSQPSGSGNITNVITGAAVNGEQLDFYNGNNIIFSTPLENLKDFLLPLSGGTMTGALNMGGNKISGLGDAVNDGDALAYGQAKDEFAPSGYGLGLNKPENTLDDANRATQTGVYRLVANAANGTGDLAGVLDVVSYQDGYVVQNFYRQESANVLRHLRRFCIAGTWQPWEWVNPPMAPGVKYRTTRRINGKTVFVLSTELSWARNGVVSIPTGQNYPFVFECNARIGGHHLPYMNDTLTQDFTAYYKVVYDDASPQNISFQMRGGAGFDGQGVTAEFWFYY